ncbi:MAG: ATP synthase F1 subunit delta [Floccifex sp.]
MVVSYKPYSLALFELAKEQNKIEFYRDQLKELSLIWKENHDFMLALSHPKITRIQKKEWITQCFESKIDAMLFRFLLVMVEHDVIGFIPEIYEAYIEVYKEDLNIENVIVESACVLSKEELDQIRMVIEAKLDKKIEIQTNIVPELIAGIRVTTKDFVLDNSVLSRINSLKNKLERTN